MAELGTDSALFSINVSWLVNQELTHVRRARLVLGWVTVSGFESRSRHLGIIIPQVNSAWPSLRDRRKENKRKQGSKQAHHAIR